MILRKRVILAVVCHHSHCLSVALLADRPKSIPLTYTPPEHRKVRYRLVFTTSYAALTEDFFCRYFVLRE
jgi:hypothetical protein